MSDAGMRRREILTKVLCWRADTPVEYKPEGKRAGTASYVRYERYSKAKTVGEALALGSKAEDLINDFVKGILEVKGGPVREKPLEMEELNRGEGVTDTDRALAKFAKGFHRVELASQLGMDCKTVAAKRSWCESPAMHAKRLMVQRTAEATLQELEEQGGKVTDEHILTLLRQWSFRRNGTRGNVAPDNKPVVDSDTFGVMRNQAGTWIITHATRDYPAVTKVLVRWLRDNLPVEGFSCTSIHVNSGFAARRHRDRANLGPAFMRALGDFRSGGQLWYWPEDDGKAALECLPIEARVALDVRSAPALINGNRAHEVEPFEGERFGIVFYTIARSEKIPSQLRTELAEYGFILPDKEKLAAAGRLFAAPRGYGLPPAPTKRPQGEDAPGARKRGRKAKVARAGSGAGGQSNAAKNLLARLVQGANVVTDGKAKQSKSSALKQGLLRFKTKDEPKLGGLKRGVLKLKSKASGGLLARMLAKGTEPGGDAGRQREAQGTSARAVAEGAAAPKAGAASAGTTSGSSGGAEKPIKVHPGGLLARVIAKNAKEAAAASTAAGSEGGDTPPRKRSSSSGAARGTGGAAAGPVMLSSKKQRASGAGKGGAQAAAAVAATGQAEKPGGGAAEADAPPAAPAAGAPAAAPPLAQAVRAAALALGLSEDALPGGAGAEPAAGIGREAVLCQHFLPLANLMRLAEEKPASTVELLADYFQVLLQLGGEQSEALLRAALGLLLPAGAAPAEALAAAAAEAFGPSMARLTEEKGLAEAALEGRRAKRSLRAPPPRLTLAEAAEALEASRAEERAAGGGDPLARALAATRTEGSETLFLVKLLRCSSGLSMGSVHAAVARALVQAHGGAR